MEPDLNQPQDQVIKESRVINKKLLIVLFIVVVAAVFLFYQFGGKVPSNEVVLDDSSINNTEFGFSINYPDNWTALESRFIDRIDDDGFVVADNIADCGFDCAVTYKAVIKEGEENYLTVSVFGNKDKLPLDVYLKAFLKDVNKDTFQEFKTESGINGWKEEINFDDGREVVNFYYAKGDFIYWISKDILVDNEQERSRLSNEIDLIIETFKI